MNRVRVSRPVGLLVVALCTAALLLVGCGGRSPGKAVKEFRVFLMDEPKRLDPAYVKDLFEGIVSGFVYDNLVRFGEGAAIEPGLAERWEISEDKRTYTFHLRQAKFSNGHPVTSADVRYSLTRILRPETVSDRKWVLNRIEGADGVTSGITKDLAGLRTPDDRTVVITLARPYPPFLTMLGMPNAAIIEKDAAGADKPNKEFDLKPYGSGPWVLEKWLHDQRLEFRPNEHFWGPKPKIERLICLIQVDDNVQRRQFETGNVDIYEVSFTVFPTWNRDPTMKERMISFQEINTYYVGVMCNKPVLSDKRVRQAIAHGINIKSIFEDLQKGRGELAHGPVPPGIPGYRADIQPREHDPEKAKRLLAEAGVKDLTLTFWYREEALGQEMVQSIKGDLEKIGIKLVVVTRDLASFREAIWNGEPDLFFGSWWLDYPDVENAVVPTFHSRNIPRQGNQCHFSDPEVDRLLEDAEHEPDEKVRIAKYEKAIDRTIEEAAWIPLYHRKVYKITQPWVVGWKPRLMYNAERYLDVDIDLAKRKR